MSKTRKILSVVLAVVLVFALSVPAFAYNWEAADNGYSQTWALGTPVAVEGKTDEYTIDVSLTTDYATGAVQFVLAFTGDVALTGVTLGDGFYENADLFKDNDTGKVMLIPTTSDPNALDAVEIDGVVAVLTVTGTLGTVAIVENVKSEANTGGTLMAARLDPETLLGAQYVGQELVTVGNAVPVGSVATPVLKGISTGFVDAERKYVYGAPAALNVYTDYYTVENGTFSVLGLGTGAVLTVKDIEGTECDNYTVVIFGDVNGDNTVTGADSVIVSVAALGGSIADEAQAFAADVNGDTSVTGADSVIISVAALGGDITVNPYAAN